MGRVIDLGISGADVALLHVGELLLTSVFKKVSDLFPNLSLTPLASRSS